MWRIRSVFCSNLLVIALTLGVIPPAHSQISWTPTGGPGYGGEVRSAQGPNPDGGVWAVIYGAGIYRSIDGGATWQPHNNGLVDLRVWSLNVNTLTTTNTNADTYKAYAATRGGGVFKTTDGGQNWSAINSGLGCGYVRQLLRFTPQGTTTERLLAGTECGANSGVYISTNDGATWSATTGLPANVQINLLTRVLPRGTTSTILADFLLAATDQGMYKSADNGATWVRSDSGIAGPNGAYINSVGSIVQPISPTTANTYVLATVRGAGVFRSTDLGQTYTSSNTGLPARPYATAGFLVDSQLNAYVPIDGAGVYKSTDKAVTWSLFADNVKLPGVRVVITNNSSNNPTGFYASTFAGAYRSTDAGATWIKGAGLPGGHSVNVVKDAQGNIYGAGGDGVYQLVNGAWQRVGGTNIGELADGGNVLAIGAGLFVSTYNFGVFKLVNGQWQAMNNGLPANLVARSGHLRADPNNDNGLYVGLEGDGVYYSADGGATWTAKNGTLTGGSLLIHDLRAGPTMVVIATDGGVFKSTNPVTTWTALPFPAVSPANSALPVNRLALDDVPGTASGIYAAVFQTDPLGVSFPNSGIWKSIDAGQSWVHLTQLVGKQARAVSVARNASSLTLYAALWDQPPNGGAWQSTDGGTTWTAINAGLTNNYVNSFGIFNGALQFAATIGDGVLMVPALTFNLLPSWNLVGNGMSSAITVSSMFGDSSLVSTVWKWIASSSAWAFYTPTLSDGGAAYAAGKGYTLLTTINAGEGFWVNAKNGFSAQLSGSPVSTSSFADGLTGNTLPTGWSLIAIGDNKTPAAFANTIAVNPPVAGTTVATSLTTLWAWDAALAGWYFFAPSLVNAGTQAGYITSKGYLDFATKTLTPTTGFWVNKP